MQSFYTEPKRDIPVYGEYDVVIVGGGTSGVTAALAAAREGLKVLIVEQFGSLGGSATMAVVLPVMYSGIAGNPQCSYFGQLISEATDSGHHDPLRLRIIFDNLCKSYNIEILYQTVFSAPIMEDKTIKGIIIENIGGRYAIFAKRIIDCTGDADVAASAGAAYEKGNPRTGKCQPISLRYILGGVNIEEFAAFLSEQSENGYNYKYPNFYTAVTAKADTPLSPFFAEAVKCGDLEQADFEYWQVFGIPGRHDGLAFNCPEFFDELDSTDPRVVSKTHTEGRRRINRQLEFYKKYFKGFENAYIAEISEMIGVRESRRIISEYYLTAEDVIKRKKFEDAICQSNYPVDIHGAGDDYLCNIIDSPDRDSVPYYEIPYGVLIPKGFDNLLVAGRCSGFDFVAQSSTRVIHSCRAFGEAAGIACKISIAKGIRLKEVNGREVREKMIAGGAKFAEKKTY